MTSGGAAEGRDVESPLTLSVVVTIVDGDEALARFLEAMTAQRGAPALEVLVPFDASLGSLATLRAAYPTVRWLDLGEVATARPITGAGGQHELYDRRRSAALRVATGDIVAILEDRGIPRPDWAATACRLHAEPAAVIGGAIEPTPGRLLEWALHVCDFSRYVLPLAHGPAAWVSDVNVTYKRRALSATRHLWSDRFHEPAVHWELERRGETLLLSPDLVVEHRRRPKPIGRVLAERFHWGRLFGYIRAGELTGWRRTALVLSAPLVPVVVAWRHARVWRRRGETARFVAALPIILALLVAWAIGEAIGTATGRA